MGLTPTYQKDPLAPLKMKPGVYAEVFFKSEEPGISGARLWLKVKDVDHSGEMFTGEVVTKPTVKCGVSLHEEVTLALAEVEQVSNTSPV